MDKKFYYWALFTTIFALIVISLGAFTRLSDAGLGCPDWPGCYGKLVLPKAQHAIAHAQIVFPDKPLDVFKAWVEMVHRYFAGALGLLIFALGVWAFLQRQQYRNRALYALLFLCGFVIFQAALGMWTVTWQLLPLIVTLHLLGGMTIVALLWWVTLSSSHDFLIEPRNDINKIKPWAIAALIILSLQIFLGAWTSTHYAALACPNFPFCRGSLFPQMAWRDAFNFLTPIGPNYEGGHLEMIARVTIQMAHRYGAFILTVYFIPLICILLTFKRFRPLKKTAIFMLIFLALQVVLGILNVELTLPMWSAVLHNVCAALLLCSVVTLLYRTHRA